ncbi:MAG TPA: nicotinate-nucleotide--dimethylbenzimidazole phosphoribosyltransferase [Clostridiales bacterium]|nr:nicotinate-nucleotide--dimethylbenzimidazole phosphoribosyltransferase [Clostridiales bacterium]
MNLQEIISQIVPADREAMEQASAHNDNLLKPLGSLGRLEKIAIRMAGITGQVCNRAEKRCLIVMAADNGVCEEGVAGTPQDMTRWHIANIAGGVSGVGVLARYAHADLKVVDIGIKGDPECALVLPRKIRSGTANFAREPAMNRQEAEEAILVGVELVREAKEEGYEILGTGEMGIGNTSTTSACVMALTGLSADEAVGKGGGLTDQGLDHKKEVIRTALALHKPDSDDPMDVLSKVGGLDIAGLAGCYLGAARYRLPIVIDGAISALAALIAYRLAPASADFMFASHRSEEPSYGRIVRELGLAPCIDLDMRLGEGTGCALAFPIIGAACSMLSNMHTFAQAQLDQNYRIDIREGQS